jgi:DNA-binding XRE family transcriptional regulator
MQRAMLWPDGALDYQGVGAGVCHSAPVQEPLLGNADRDGGEQSGSVQRNPPGADGRSEAGGQVERNGEKRMKIGAVIKIYRNHQDLTLEKLAEEIDVSLPTLQRIESGRGRSVDGITLYRLFVWLFGGQGQRSGGGPK